MSEIRVLDDSTINKIAAGEVVSRPASAVKELVENAIDAGASQITVEIRDGGTSYIRVSDNGRGIGRGQTELAFTRHATSKITTSEDIDEVMSLGFRGEALASLAAVALVEMTTKTDADTTASVLRVEGGVVVKRSETGGTTGTSIEVRNLFYNTPARRKFMKSVRGESGAVSDAVSYAALSRPDIAFRYVNNGAEVFRTSGNGGTRAAVLQIYGIEYAKNMMDIEFRGNGIRVEGLLGKPDIARGNRLYEIFFINGRYVRSPALSRAAESAYRALMSGRFPFFVMHIGLDPGSIDVNVHPTKLEVRFSDETAVFRAVFGAVEEALAGENLIPDIGFVRRPSFAEVTQTAISSYTPVTLDEAPDEVVQYGRRAAREYSFDEASFAQEPYQAEQEQAAQQVQGRLPFSRGYTVVGQVFATYWIIEHMGTMYMMDQHAAHEKVMYEEILSSLARGEAASQMLLEPVTFCLTESEDAVLARNLEAFERMGFCLRRTEARRYEVSCIPNVMDAAPDASFFMEAIGAIEDSGVVPETSSARMRQLVLRSCKAAVKGNDWQSEQECRRLLAKLDTLENPFTCPHGRPTIIEISRGEIERKFKRI
ncbi:MAG: DNA mismatch repair endonuclease MutL [Defluviitaleaceae bacterium]|nr:DNA mismatch repair endonuclease MutL [Defluviitaleaceae bacterium]